MLYTHYLINELGSWTTQGLVADEYGNGDTTWGSNAGDIVSSSVLLMGWRVFR